MTAEAGWGPRADSLLSYERPRGAEFFLVRSSAGASTAEVGGAAFEASTASF